jgi:hypothetical protein
VIGDISEYPVVEVSSPIQGLWIKLFDSICRDLWSGEYLFPNPVVVRRKLSKEINKDILFKRNVSIAKCALERTSGWGIFSNVKLFRENNTRAFYD